MLLNRVSGNLIGTQLVRRHKSGIRMDLLGRRARTQLRLRQLLSRGTAGPRQTKVLINTCRYCGIESHWQADCPERLKKSFKEKGASTMPPGNHNPGRTGQKFNRNNVLSSPSRMRGEIYLEIKIRTKIFGALLDTGCRHSVIGRKLIPTMKLEPTTQMLCTASGADLPLLGECVFYFRLDDYPTSVKVVVTENSRSIFWG